MLKNEIWVMSPRFFGDLLNQIESLGAMFASGVDVHAARQSVADAPVKAMVDKNGTAHFSVSGPVMKSVPWFVRALGVEATPSRELAQAIEEADASEGVQRISLEIDSPGGSLSGLQELADAVHATSKPISAYAGDLAASAAYWVGSQADEFSAGRGASIGSIGVYTVVEDISRALANEGVDVHVVSSGGVKGGMVDGVPLSPEVREDIQREIDEAAELFLENIQRGRGLDARHLATGRTWLAPTALKHGLIDRVESRRNYLARLGASAPEITTKAPSGGVQTMEGIGMADSKEDSNALEAKFASLAGRLEALEKEKAQMEARAAAAEESLKATEAAQKAETIAKAQRDGRVVPSMVPAVKRLAETMSPGELSKHLEGFPVVVRQEAEGQGDAEVSPPSDHSRDEVAVAKAFGISVDELRAANDIKGVRANGALVRKEGAR